MAHAHSHGAHAGSTWQNGRALATMLSLTAAFLVVEVVCGLITGSLALFADAAHMASGSVSLALALFAF